MRAVIGLLPMVSSRKSSFYMPKSYMDAVEAAGGMPLMLPLTEDGRVIREIVDRMDGFLLTGGHDLSPELYGEEPLESCGERSPERDDMERLLLQLAIGADKPVLGICRGIQLINAFLGGSLYQDLPSQRPSPVEHDMAPPYDRAAHEVKLLPGEPLRVLLGREKLSVNSYHHQGIKTLSPHVRPMAVAEDGLVEAIYVSGRRFIWGLQWHPEDLFLKDESSRLILKVFAESCGTGR